MPILMPSEQQSFENAPLGSHIATLYQVIDLGTQINDYNPADKKIQRQVMFTWELPNTKMKDGRPFSINKTYTLSSHEKANLVNDINAWRGRAFTPAEFGAFDIEKLIGKSCFLQVIEKTSKKGKVYSKVGAIMALPAGQQSIVLINKPLAFSLANFNQEIFNSIPEYWRTMIAASPEYREIIGHNEQHENEPPPVDHERDYLDQVPF